MTQKRKPGRPPKNESGAMTAIRVRVTREQRDYLDAQPGTRSEALRNAIDDASAFQRWRDAGVTAWPELRVLAFVVWLINLNKKEN